MAYPKPLSTKTLERQYSALGLSEQTLGVLRGFFVVCSKLYGAIDMGEVWEVYKVLNNTQGFPALRRRNLLEFASVARRDVSVPYYVLEINEIYRDEPVADSKKMIVNKELVGFDTSKYYDVITIDEKAYGKPPYIPDNFLSWNGPPKTDEEKALLNFLGNLRVSAKEVEVYGYMVKCEHVGEKLKDFVFESEIYRIAYKWFSGEHEDGRKTSDQKRLDRLKRSLCSNAAEYLVEEARKDFDYRCPGSRGFQRFFDNLYEIGVKLTELQSKIVLDFLQEFVNNCHRYSNKGWTPMELGRRSGPMKGPLSMSFGPGVLEAMRKGDIDRTEVENFLKEHGIEPVN